YCNRYGTPFRICFSRKFRLALSGAVASGILDPLAHDLNAVDSRLYFHPAYVCRTPASEFLACLAACRDGCLRIMARRAMDVRLLGSVARIAARREPHRVEATLSPTECFWRSDFRLARDFLLRRHFRTGDAWVDIVPRGIPGAGLGHDSRAVHVEGRLSTGGNSREYCVDCVGDSSWHGGTGGSEQNQP